MLLGAVVGSWLTVTPGALAKQNATSDATCWERGVGGGIWCDHFDPDRSSRTFVPILLPTVSGKAESGSGKGGV